MKRYRAGVVGLGRSGMLYGLDPEMSKRYPHQSHAACYAAHPRTELVAGCDRNADRRGLFERRYAPAKAYDDYSRLFAGERLDLVSISVSPVLQPEVIRSAVKAHVPMIFCENPLGTTSEVASELLELCRGEGVGLAVNYWRRFDASHQRIHRLITEGRIGPLQHLHGFYGKGRMRNASHLIHLWVWIAGRIDWVLAVPGTDELPEDPNAEAILGFANGALGTLAAVSYEAYRLLEADLLGTEGRVVIQNEGLDLKVYGTEPNEDVPGTRQLSREIETFPGTFKTAMVRAVDTLTEWLDRGERPIQEDAVETLAVLEAMARSAAEGGRKVPVVSPSVGAREVMP